MRIAGAKVSKANPEVALSECEKLLERLRKRPADPAADMAWRQAEHLREVEQIAAHFRAMV